MRNNVQHPRTSIATMASRTLFALAAALPMAVAADVTINITAPRPQSFESNPSNYGEIQVTRSAALPSALAVTLQLNAGPTTNRFASYPSDFALQLNPADAANASLDLTNAGTGTVVVTFNSGYSNARIQVIAVPDIAVFPPELGEIVTLSNPIIPPSSGIVIGGNQRGTVTIVDANVQAQTYVDQSPAREILGDDINNYVQGAGDGRMRLWFPNSSAFSNVTPTTSYSTYGNRFVEISNAGSSATAAADFIATYRIGGNQRCVERFGVVIEPKVTSLANALREQTEYLNSTYQGGGIFPGYSDPLSGQVIATAPGAALTSISVEPVTLPTGVVITSIQINGVTTPIPGSAPAKSISIIKISQGSLSGKNRIVLNGFSAVAPLAEGSLVSINYTDPSVVPATISTLFTTVTMPILYPQGATSLSVTNGASPVQLSKGDVFVVDGWAYRITGTKIQPGGGASLGDYEIFFTPGLRKDLLRTSPLTITSHFEAKFDNNGRETFFIPALPTTPFYGYPNRVALNPAALNETGVLVSDTLPLLAADLPNGDWVDLLFRPIDDAAVEGREDILVSLNVTTANNGYDVITPAVADIPLGDDDVIVATKLASNAQVPTGDGAFLIELSQAFSEQVLVPFTILQNGSTDAIYGTDYSVDNTARDSNGNVSGVVIVPKGTLSVIVTVKPLASSTLLANQSKSVRIALDDSLDYALAGTESSSTNASASSITITRTSSNTNPVPLIKSTRDVAWTIGDPTFFYQILADNIPAVSYDAIGLPTGLTIDKNNGTISGRPTVAVGDYEVLLKAITATGGYGSAKLTISIKAQPAPVISPPLTASGTANVGFSYQIVANGNPVSYSATNLPAGLVVNTTTGAITGTPTASGPTNVTITATNSSNITGSATLIITIAVGAVPVISPPLTATVAVGTAFTYQIVASGNPTSYNATPLPAGLSVNLATGVISGTPTAAGQPSVTISATNAGGTTSATLVITVNAAVLPTITSATTAAAVVGTAFTYQITASGNPTAYSATDLPAGLTVNTTTGLISGAPTTVGSSSATIGATNSSGTKTITLMISVTAAGATTVTQTPAPGNGEGGVCGAGSGLAALLGSLSLMLMRLTGRRR